MAEILQDRVVIVTPTGDDAALASRILRDAGADVLAVPDLAGAAAEAKAGAGALLIACEALADERGRKMLREVLDAQESWSELPILLIGGGAEAAERVPELLGGKASVVLLERPLAVATLLTAVDAALRSRRRQYDVQRLLVQLAESSAELARAHEEAERAKDEFLATLAHELRSPMTAIRGWIQMLKTGDLPPEEATDALSMIEASTKVQAHIIEDLMDVSRIIAGKIMIEPAVIPLAPVVTNIVATFRPAAILNGIDLTAEIAREPIFVNADDARLQQVGWNLLSNAIKFTPRGGAVHVTLTHDAANAVLRVRDTGEGISPELLPKVFERYRQEEGAGGKAHQGLGLGLAIVRHLVESHGGTIRALSEGRGKGAEFVVTLPLHRA
jgi:signal transduction histidine kinase